MIEMLVDFLKTKNEMFQEVTYLSTGFDYSDDNNYAVWTAPDEKKCPDAGGCTSVPVVQDVLITVVHPIAQDTPEQARQDVSAVTKKIEAALRLDLTLGNSIIQGRILAIDEGEDVVNGNRVKLGVIRFQGKYWR